MTDVWKTLVRSVRTLCASTLWGDAPDLLSFYPQVLKLFAHIIMGASTSIRVLSSDVKFLNFQFIRKNIGFFALRT